MRWPVFDVGVIGSSLISVPASTGIHSSSRQGQHAENAGLGLAAKAEEEQVVLGEDAVDDLRDDRFAIADDAGEKLFAGLSACG